MRIARDLIVALRIKLKLFGIPIDGGCDVYCDNDAVYKNMSNPESALTKKDDGYIIKNNGDKVPKKTTVGWDVLVEWNDGSTQWIPIKDVKESNPIELAE